MKLLSKNIEEKKEKRYNIHGLPILAAVLKRISGAASAPYHAYHTADKGCHKLF